MTKQQIKRLYKPVKSLAELRIKLIEEDRKIPHPVHQAGKYEGRIEAYQDIIEFMDKLVEDIV